VESREALQVIIELPYSISNPRGKYTKILSLALVETPEAREKSML
jgi:hypothetical protein